MSRSIERNLLIWLVCALAPIGIVGYISHQQTTKVVSSNEAVIHTHEVKEEMESIESLLNAAETSMRGFVITGKEDFLEPYLHASPLIEEHIRRLGGLIAENPEQMRRLHAVQPIIVAKLDNMGDIIIVRKEKDLQSAAVIVSEGEGKKLMDEIVKQLDEMEDAETKLLDTRNKKSKTDTARALNVTTILTVFALILVACNVFFARLRL